MQFKTANLGFQDYMKRTGAVDVENDYYLRSEDEQTPDHRAGYEKYVDYMSRKKATDVKGEKLLPTFTATTNNLTKDEELTLRDKLHDAEDHQNLMWQGVISFRTDFLKEQNLYNPETGQLDQLSLKRALQNTMPNFLKRNEFGNNAFWWADIHLNTNHVHIHFGLSETGESKRPKHGDEIKGMLKQNSMRQLRGEMFRDLELDEDRELELINLQKLNEFKQKNINEFRTIETNELIQNQILNQAYKRLPLKKPITSFKSNRKDFKGAKRLLQQYINNQLLHNNDFKKYQELLKHEQDHYINIYGISRDNYVKNQINLLKTSIGNQLLKQLYQLDESDLKSQNLTSEPIKNATLEQNQLTLDILKRKLAMEDDHEAQKKLKYQISLRRIQIRHQNLEKKLEQVSDQQNVLKKITNGQDDPLITFLQDQLRREQKLAQLSIRASYRLSPEERQLKKLLQHQLIDPIKISVTSRLLQDPTEFVKLNQEEQRLIRESRLGPNFFKNYYRSSALERIQFLKQNLVLLKTKQAIQKNNRIMSQTKDFRLKDQNSQLFRQLIQQIRSMEPNAQIQNFQVRRNSRNEKSNLKIKKRPNDHKVINRGLKTQTLNRLAAFTSATITKSSVRSLKEHERMDRAEEREEEMEGRDR